MYHALALSLGHRASAFCAQHAAVVGALSKTTRSLFFNGRTPSDVVQNALYGTVLATDYMCSVSHEPTLVLDRAKTRPRQGLSVSV